MFTKFNAFYVYGHFCSISEETKGSTDSGRNNKWSSANTSVGSLQRAGLDVLNTSLNTLSPARYKQVTRRKEWERVMAGIDLALQLGYSPVKVKTASVCLFMRK